MRLRAKPLHLGIKLQYKGSGALAVYEGWRNWNWPKIAPEFCLRHMKARVSLDGFVGSDSAWPKPNSSHPL